MKNLILSAACGLDPKQIEFFLKSLRTYYKDEIFFLLKKEDIEVKNLLNEYACNFLEIDVHKFDVQVKRYNFYLKILNENRYNDVLICDSRDIYFQSNPFDYDYKGSINFFLEDKKIKECPHNTNWLIKTYGEKTFEKLSNNIINCSGTTLGTSQSMKVYLNLMIKHSLDFKFKKRLKYFLTFRRDKTGRGADQAYANYIVHNKLIKNSFLYSNESGPIATVYYLKKIIFDTNHQLINSINRPYSIVHQYDKRWDEFEVNVKEIKKNLNIK
ncbi:MAG: hypothetical protein ACJZ8J_03500 [Candidatus Pelagibacter sp.]